MIYDIKKELHDFTYLTNIYKYIESYNLVGHQIGRKVGDMLEMLTLGGLFRDDVLRESMEIENKLEGFTTAGHKVEFGFYTDAGQLFGAIECKCVGVEVARKASRNSHISELNIGDIKTVKFSNHWQNNGTINCNVCYIKQQGDKAIIEVKWKNKTKKFKANKKDTLKFAMDENEKLHVIISGEDMYAKIPSIIRSCKIIKVDNIDTSKIKISEHNCLPGPQTPEKAKQASLVAMDLRKKIDNHWGKDDIPEDKKNMISALVLCEFSHWENKSQNVIKTCIDHNIIVPDEIIIQSFMLFDEIYGRKNLLKHISKRAFLNDESVRNAIYRIIDKYESNIFYDIELKQYIDFKYTNNRLSVIVK